MMSRHSLFPLSLAIATLGALCSPAASQSPVSTAGPVEPATVRPLVKPGDYNCLRSTGSRIRPKAGECLPVAGRAYRREDIERTGARNTADALRMLDPRITIGH
jgi:hypothetical protein